MKRYTLIKNMLSILDSNDILIFVGAEVCKEAYEHHQDNHFYIDDHMGIAISVAVGMAMCTDKRIFVFAGEGELLRETGVLAQMGASKCRNIFLILLDNDCYQSAGGHPNIFGGLLSKKGFIYNARIKIYVFNSQFKNKLFGHLKAKFEKFIGPTAVLMDVDKGFKRSLPPLSIDHEQQAYDISKLIMKTKKKIEPSRFHVTPISFDEVKTLDIDSLKTGGIN